MSEEPSNPDHSYATRERLGKIELALFGENGRGGMVKDVNDIKANLGIVRTLGVPILIAVVTAVIMKVLPF